MASGNEEVPVYYHPDYEIPTQTPGHPESPERIKEIMRTIDREGLPVRIMDPLSLIQDDLGIVHVENHIRRVRDFGVGFMDPDTYHTEKVYEQSLKAAGGVLSAGRQSCTEGRPTFAIPRPPGHHAGADYNMGFCYFNNVAIAARTLQREFDDIGKVVIIDIDAHHGNGTSDIFMDDPSVLYISTHNWGIFPGTGHLTDVGEGKGEGYTVNIPFEWGIGDPTFSLATQDIIMPVIRQFSPDMIFISLGADAHQMDPLAGLTLSTPGHIDVVKAIYDYSKKENSSRLCMELEGGYHTYALAEVVAGSIDAVSEEPKGVNIRYPESKERSPSRKAVESIVDVQSGYWKV